APVLRQIARYLPHHRSKNASKTHPKSSHDKFKTASEDMNYRPGYIRCVRDATIEERNSAVAWNGN
ncbi:hypothetical protein H6B32_17765, partial [Bacteroides gallinaceum]|uniref:hypothetical protein n=1 Tax=Bacteroides gallinaceum TaxID=1462571 RepID=UPI00195E69F4